MSAIETTKERLWEAEIHRIANEITLKSPEPDTAKAQSYFERALAVVRALQGRDAGSSPKTSQPATSQTPQPADDPNDYPPLTRERQRG